MFKCTVLKYGMEGKEVEKMQKALQKSGSTVKVTGKYHIGMVSAVKAFQKRNNLKVTGTIDAKTKAKLEELLKPAKKVSIRKPAVKK